MKEGTCKTTKTGRRFCKIGGRVRFTSGLEGRRRKRSVGNVDGMGPVDSLTGLVDPVGVSLGDLSALAKGIRKCIKVITPDGIRQICASVVKKRRTRKKKSVAGLGKRKTTPKRTTRRTSRVRL